MTDRQQKDIFARELDKLITRFTDEFEMRLDDIVGVLECVKMTIFIETAYDIIEEEVPGEDA